MTYPEHMYVVELAFDDDPRRVAARPAHRERWARCVLLADS
jgi:hypothetical protein